MGSKHNAAMPVLSRSFHNSGAVDHQYVLLAVPVSLVSVAALTGFVYLTGDTFIPFLFGSTYTTVAEFLAFGLMVFLAPYAAASLLSNAALMRGLFKWSASIAVISICLAVASAFYLVLNWSVYGLLLSFGGGGVVWTALLFLRLKKRTEGTLQPRQLFE